MWDRDSNLRRQNHLIDPGGVAPFADAERLAVRTPAPQSNEARREAIGIVVLIVMVISCYVGSPSTASSRAPGQEHPAHDHAPHHADAGPDETRIDSVRCPESAGQPGGAAQQAEHDGSDGHSAFEIRRARHSPNAEAMISIARGNEVNTKPAHTKSFRPDVSR